MSTLIKPIEQDLNSLVKIKAYTPTALALQDLKSRYHGVVFDLATPAGIKQAKEARAEIKGYRVELEKTRVAIKADALEQCRLIDSEAKRIKDALEELEIPIDQQIKAEEKRKEDERLAAEQAEMARVQSIQQRIIHLRNIPVAMSGKSSEDIRDALHELTDLRVDSDSYAEFIDHAQAAKAEAITALTKMADDMARLEAERAELARLRQEAEARAQEEAAQKAEQDRLAEEQRAREQAELKAERERLAQERAEHDAQVKAEAEQRAREDAARKAEQDRIEAERRRVIEAEQRGIEQQKAELKRQQEAARREEEHAKAEAQRRQQEERERAEREAYAEMERRQREADEQATLKEMEDELSVLVAEVNNGELTLIAALLAAYQAGVKAERRRHV